MAFKGNIEDIKPLIEQLEKDGEYFSKNENENTCTVSLGGFNEEKVLSLVEKYSNLKACAFLDGFEWGGIRKTYVVYSKPQAKEFTKIEYVGMCDGQSDIAFSEEVDLFTKEVAKYSSIISSTGIRAKISYQFPFEKEWEN